MATETAHHVVVTGASQGIGEAIAKEFARRIDGVTLSLLARSEEGLRETADACRRHGAMVHIVPCDLTSDAEVEQAASTIADLSPDVTGLVNNAGMFEPGALEDTNSADVMRQFDVNVMTAFRMSKQLLPGMMERRRGHIFFMGSVASTIGYPGGFSYCIAKHGVLGLARGLREDTKEHDVAVTCVMPGATWSPSWHGAGVEEERLMPAEDIAAAIVQTYQMSPRSVVEEILIRPQKGDV